METRQSKKAHKCPECGSEFFPTGDWVYKIEGKNNNVYYCRWSCYREALKKKEIQRKVKHNRRVLERARALA